jgi:hypothetical protein
VSEVPRLLAGVHPEIAHLSWLVGTWTGRGVAEYVGKTPFDFEQVVEFGHSEEPFLTFKRSSWIVDGEGNRVEVFESETGMWFGESGNLVRVELAEFSDHPRWLGKTQVAEIVDATITRARLSMYVPAGPEPDHVQPDLGVRSYGIFEGKLLMVHEKGFEDSPDTDKISIMMERIND